jgi:hypothetical protein
MNAATPATATIYTDVVFIRLTFWNSLENVAEEPRGATYAHRAGRNEKI